MSWLRKVIVWGWLLTCLCGGLLAGCNTLEGAGQDIEQAGEGIQDVAD